MPWALPPPKTYRFSACERERPAASRAQLPRTRSRGTEHLPDNHSRATCSALSALLAFPWRQPSSQSGIAGAPEGVPSGRRPRPFGPRATCWFESQDRDLVDAGFHDPASIQSARKRSGLLTLRYVRRHCSAYQGEQRLRNLRIRPVVTTSLARQVLAGEAVRVHLSLRCSAPSETAAALRGQRLSDSVLEAAGREAAEACRPISDVRASAEYRREMVNVLTRRAVRQAAALAAQR